jgi:hypothetical protein
MSATGKVKVIKKDKRLRVKVYRSSKYRWRAELLDDGDKAILWNAGGTAAVALGKLVRWNQDVFGVVVELIEPTADVEQKPAE